MKLRNVIIASVVAVVAVSAAGAVYAAWSASGSGAGQASSLTAQTITVSAASGSADLYPGFTAGDLQVEVSNPNPYDVSFTSFSAGTITSSDPGNCASSNVSVDDTDPISLVISAGANGVVASIADVVSMQSSAPDGCQGVVFTVTVTLSGSQI